MTRAQRKRLRKRKLKEDAFRRSKIIGPLMPPPDDEGDSGGGGNVSSSVRRNAHEECSSNEDKSSKILEQVLIVLMHTFVLQSLTFGMDLVRRDGW